MSSKPELKLDWCSHAAAKYAVEKWHYSRSMPAGKTVKVGVWEGPLFTGAIIFGRGANRNIGKEYGLAQVECCELTRIALNEHRWPVSRMVAIALRILKGHSPGLKLVISYADPEQSHFGSIYQAGGWVYVGTTKGGTDQILLPDGRRLHKRSAYSRYGMSSAAKLGGIWVRPAQKHKYLKPLSPAIREKVARNAKPYPKRAGSADSGTPGDQPGGGGAIPTPALSSDD